MEKKGKNVRKTKKKKSKPLKNILKRSFWKSRLPWPQKIVRKPKIRLDNPFIGKKIPSFLTSRYVVLILVYVVLYFFLSGGMYFLIGAYRSIPMGYGQGNPPEPIIYLRSLNDQFIIEGILSAFFIFIALGGFLFMYMGTKNFSKPSTCYVYLAIGIILVIIGFFLLEIAMYQKGIKLYDESLYSVML
ncbi:MAG: hypothetical protein ACTSRP_00410 [Candidatus Helarchaeota archaeon]